MERLTTYAIIAIIKLSKAMDGNKSITGNSGSGNLENYKTTV